MDEITDSNITRKFYTVKECCIILGMAKSTLYNFIRSGAPFKVKKIGHDFRVDKASFDEWANKDDIV